MPKKAPPAPSKPPRAFIDITPSIAAIPTRLNLQDEMQLARLLGMGIVAWAYAEEAMMLILGALLEVDQARAEIVFYASKSEQFRVELIRRLAKHLKIDSVTSKNLSDSLKSFTDLIGQRNTYVHGLWKYNDRSELEIIPTRSGPIEWFRPQISVSVLELKQFFDDVMHVEQQLLSALNAVRAALREKSLERSRRQTQRIDPPQKSTRARRKPPPRSSPP